MAIATACSIGSFIIRASWKDEFPTLSGENARANLNDTLLKRGYVVAILCHGSSLRILTRSLESFWQSGQSQTLGHPGEVLRSPEGVQVPEVGHSKRRIL